MSILQDLDPKYAKMQAQPSSISWKAMTLFIVLAVTTLGAAWLYTSKIDHQKPEIVAMQEQIAKSQLAQPAEQAKSVTPAEPQLPAAEAKVDQDAVMSEGKATDAATIRNVDVNEAPNPQISSGKSGTTENIVTTPDKQEALAVSNSQNASVTPTKIAESQPTSRPAKPKLAKRKTTHAPATVDSGRPPMASKKATERDIDIISAIVR